MLYLIIIFKFPYFYFNSSRNNNWRRSWKSCGLVEFRDIDVNLVSKINVFIFFSYEMIYGIPPFYNQNQNMMFQLIRDSEVPFPKVPETSMEVKDIIIRV